MNKGHFVSKYIFIMCAFLGLTSHGFSQEMNEEVAYVSSSSGWNPNALYVQFGGIEGGRYTTDFNLIKRFIDIENMPGVLESDFNNLGYYSIGMGGGVQVMLSHPSRRGQVGRVAFDWRYGVFGGDQQLAYTEFNEQNSFAYDTLVSVATQQEFIIDSVMARDWSVSARTTMIGVKTEYIGRVISRRRAEFYLGIGLSAGLLTNGSTEYRYSESYFTEVRGEGYFGGYDNEPKEGVNYSIKQANGVGWLASFNVPAGVSINLGKKRDFWKRLYLNYELAPSLTLMSTRDGGTIVSSGFNFVSGLRINL
ncbi:MAG: hypothetical protein RL204_1517 [Bacteroidota bacterium]|jgi:hypothetical protein